MLKERLISAMIGVVLFFLVIFSNSFIITAAVLLIVEIALWEMYHAVGLGEKYVLMIFGAFVPVVFLFDFPGEIPKMSYLVICLYLMVLFAVLVIRHAHYTFGDMSKFFTITLMVSLFFAHIVWIRKEPVFGIWNTIAVFVGAWLTDSCAYFAGRALGRHKLAPVVSPKKTVEGSIGGIIGAAVFMVIYGAIVGRFTSVIPDYKNLVILGLICGLVSQLGDLSMSAIKREYNIKDYGNIMPGHGGVMDRFDSVLFVAPIVYHMLKILPIFYVTIG